MSKIVKVGSWRLERSSQNKRTILVKGHGRIVESPGEFSTRLEHALKECSGPDTKW